MLLTTQDELSGISGNLADKKVIVKCDMHTSKKCQNVYNILYRSYTINIVNNNGKIICKYCRYSDNKKCNSCGIDLDIRNCSSLILAKPIYKCKQCKVNDDIYKLEALKNSENILNKIYSKNYKCIDCNSILNKNNWMTSKVAKIHRICTPCHNKRNISQNDKLKIETIDAYGGLCVCCRETELVFLTIDHIDPNGFGNRKKLQKEFNHKMTGANFYRWLKKQGYPKDNFQVLCFNCNFAKHTLGECPHETQRQSLVVLPSPSPGK